ASVGRYASVGPGASVGRYASVGPGASVGESASKPPDVPTVPHIDAAILAAVERDGCRLNMDTWHQCETTHCRAGWAIHLAGQAGYDLERYWGSWLAGTLIYRLSRPNTRTPDFYATDGAALADIREWAAKDPLPS
ncbi:MAG TPA: hypothetical protein VD866_22195, partial [Urbifossiella sp.]|nr:hypothetical protein [Urbifossiella sp.]